MNAHTPTRNAPTRRSLITVAVATALTLGALPVQAASEARPSAEARAAAEARSAYQAGKAQLREEAWAEAIRSFEEAYAQGGREAEAALFWKAWAQEKSRAYREAMRSIRELRERHPDSRWLDDACRLELELGERLGQTVECEEGYAMEEAAITHMMNRPAEVAIPALEKYLEKPDKPARLKKHAMFVIANHGGPEAKRVLMGIARESEHRDLRRNAIQMFVIMGDLPDEELIEIYEGTTDVQTKRTLLDAAMASGATGLLARVARDGSAGDLRRQAITLLGAVGEVDELDGLYAADLPKEMKHALMEAYGIAGAEDSLTQVIRVETDPEVRTKAIQSLGIAGAGTEVIVEVYDSLSDPREKRAAIDAMMIAGNARGLREMFDQETDPELKRHMLQMLSVMGDEEADDIFLDILEGGSI